MTGRRAALIIGLATVAGLPCRPAPATPNGGRTRELWPLFKRVHGDELRSVTVRPLFKVESDVREGTRRVDVLYPLFKWQRAADGTMQWWLVPVVLYTRDVDTEGRTDTDMAVLPFVFAGSSSDGTENYFAFFPFGGTMRQLLFFDKITFVAFPAYLRLERRGYTSRHVCWPVFSRGEGPGETAWRIWPFYGERRVDGAVAFRTVLWPFYSEWHKDDTSSVLVFPWYHTMRSERRRLWSVLPPFISRDVVPETQFCRWRAPWPFIELTRSDTERTTYLWPVWGRRERPGKTSSFILWPAFTFADTQRGETVRELRSRFLAFGVAETIQDEKGEPIDRYVQLWPLFHWAAGTDPSQTEVNILSPLWFRRGAERFWDMYGPFWTLYRHETRDGSAADYALGRILAFERGPERTRAACWPLCEYARERDTTEFELLKGLLAFTRDTGGRQIRLLWVVKVPGGK